MIQHKVDVEYEPRDEIDTLDKIGKSQNPISKPEKVNAKVDLGNKKAKTTDKIQNPSSNPKEVNLEGVEGKKVKTPAKRSSLGTIAKSMDKNMDKMCAMMEKVEEKRNETLRDIEMSRFALEERLAQMQVNMQLEMARIMSKRDN